MNSSVILLMGLQYGNEDVATAAYFESVDAMLDIRVVSSSSERILPKGLTRNNCVSIIPAGAAVDPSRLIREIQFTSAYHVDLTKNLVISQNCSVILEPSRLFEQYLEKMTENPVGRAYYSCGTVYASKANRTALKFSDIRDQHWSRFREDLMYLPHEFFVEFGIKQFQYLGNLQKICLKYYDVLSPLILDDQSMITNAIKGNSKVVVEGGSYGVSVDGNLYPCCSPINTSAAGIAMSAGVAPTAIRQVIGVIKPFFSRSDSKLFVSECSSRDSIIIRENAHETNMDGTPRRCGWLDLVELKQAVDVNGVTAIDVMGMYFLPSIAKQTGSIKVCTEYTSSDGSDIVPVYKEFEGDWNIPCDCREFQSLPTCVLQFLGFIEKELDTPIRCVEIAPGRILRKSPKNGGFYNEFNIGMDL